MGVDTTITLPHTTRVRDVANVLGIVCGLPWEMKALDSSDYRFLKVPGVKVEGNEIIPEMASIVLTGPLVDGNNGHTVGYHFEWVKGEGDGRGLMPRSTPFWIAAGLKLIEFFGGMIDFNDCDDIEIDKMFPQTRRASDDGQPWQEWQYAMASVVPLTRDDLVAAGEHAAYLDSIEPSNWTPR